MSAELYKFEPEEMVSDLSKQVDNLLSLIPSELYMPKQLRQLYINVSVHNERGQISDEQSEALIAEIETQMRIKDARIANKLLGPANRESRALLEGYLAELVTRFDFSENKHRTAVKTGGGVISGTDACDDYISYRHPPSKTSAQINLGKKTHKDVMKFRVSMNEVSAWGQNDTHVFVDDWQFEEAKELFETYLQRVMDGETL